MSNTKPSKARSAEKTELQRKYNENPRARHKSSEGIYYRIDRNLNQQWFWYFQGKFYSAVSAQDAKEQRGKAIGVGRHAKPVLPTKVTLEELATEWWAIKSPRLRPSTEKLYRAALDLVILPRFGNWPVARVDADAISELVRDLQKEGLRAINPSRKKRPLGRSSVEGYLSPLQGILGLAMRRHLIAVSPFACLTEDDRPVVEDSRPAHEWTPAEVEALLEASAMISAREESQYDYTPLLRVTATLGLRLGEVLGLRWEDLDLAENVLYVRRQWTRFNEYTEPKTKAGIRRLPIPLELRTMFIELKLQSGEEGPIFRSKAGTCLAHRNVTRRGFEPARDLAGLPKTLTFHDLRHNVISRLHAAGVPDRMIADLAGHSDPAVTRRTYMHVHDRRMQEDAVRIALAGVA